MSRAIWAWELASRPDVVVLHVVHTSFLFFALFFGEWDTGSSPSRLASGMRIAGPRTGATGEWDADRLQPLPTGESAKRVFSAWVFGAWQGRSESTQYPFLIRPRALSEWARANSNNLPSQHL
jgi:hypothetical protein